VLGTAWLTTNALLNTAVIKIRNGAIAATKGGIFYEIQVKNGQLFSVLFYFSNYILILRL
jgi:hypothetical protein